MTDNKKPADNDINDHGLPEDTHTLMDSPAPARWPWFLAGFFIILVVLLLQYGLRSGFAMLAKKTERKTALHHVTDRLQEAPGLPMPVREEPSEIAAIPVANRDASTDVGAFLKSRELSQPDELARLKLMARLKAHEERKKEEQEMLQSSAWLDIGVGVEHAAARIDAGKGRKSDDGFQNPNTQYLKSVSGQGVEEISASMLGDLRYRILKGKAIAGVTETAIDSDLPGIIRGHVTEDVYGAQGDIPLVHNGDELIGEYRSGDIRNGQVTLFVVWTRLRLQNGITVSLDSPGSDPLGRAGMTGHVDHHYMERYGAAVLLSAISAGAATIGVRETDEYNSLAAFRQGASASFAQNAGQELQANLSIQNSIRPPQGTEIRILVNKDISFEDVLTMEETL